MVIFYLKNLSKKFQETVLNIFSMDFLEDDDDGDDDDDERVLAASQDYPEYSQSLNTVKKL